MKIYHYEQGTKEYMKSTDARLDPLDSESFLIPANATIKEPPVFGVDETAIFEFDNWAVVTDKRGQYYYEQDGTWIKIINIGIDVPSGTLQTDPLTEYYDTHDGSIWIENTARKEVDEKKHEVGRLKSDLNSDIAWQFRMIQAMWEIGVSKGIWDATDIEGDDLKQKYVKWGQKLSRLEELEE